MVVPRSSKGDDRLTADLRLVPSRKDRFYLWIYSLLDSVIPAAALIAGLRLYGVPLIVLMWAVVGVRISRVQVVANAETIHVVNRYRTFSVDTSTVMRLQVRRLSIGQGPFAAALRLRDEPFWARLRGGVVLEATASYSGSVNDSMNKLGALVHHLPGH